MTPAEDLDRALAAWRATRHPRFADLVDRIGRAVEMAPIPGRSVAERRAAWLALASTKHPHVVSRLVEQPVPKRTSDLVEHVQLLVAFPDDPRIATALTEFVVAHHGSTSGEILHLLYQAQRRIERLGDVRQRRRFEAIAGRHVRGHHVVEGLVDPAPLAGEHLALAETLEQRWSEDVSAAHGDALFAAICAAPDDDALRLVYADWLGERGDPRGELIALQLGARTPERERREAALLAQHAADWVGPIGRFFWGGIVWERGLFAGGTLAGEAIARPDEVLADPAWPLVRHCELQTTYDDAALLALLTRRECAQLRSIGVLHIELATRFATAGRRDALEELYLCNHRHDPAIPWGGAIATLDAFPRLRTLGLRVDRLDDARSWLERAAVLERLHRLVVYASSLASSPLALDADALVDVVSRRASTLRELVIGPPARMDGTGWSFELARADATAPFAHAVARYRRPARGLKRRAYTSALVQALRSLPRCVRTLAIAHAMEPSPNVIEQALAERPDVQLVAR